MPTAHEPVRVVVVTLSPEIEQGFRALTEDDERVDLVGVAASAGEATAILAAQAPSVIVVDTGAEGREVDTFQPGVPMLVLSGGSDDAHVRTWLAAGARGFLDRDAGAEQLAWTLTGIADGASILDARVAGRVLSWALSGGPRAGNATVSPRELDVLRLIADGASNRKIAASLGMTENTVKSYLRRVFRKLGVRSRSDATDEATRLGLL